jgi:hypothetical protein
MELGLTLAAHMLSKPLQVPTVVRAVDAVLRRLALGLVQVVGRSCNIHLRCVFQLPRNQ